MKLTDIQNSFKLAYLFIDAHGNEFFEDRILKKSIYHEIIFWFFCINCTYSGTRGNCADQHHSCIYSILTQPLKSLVSPVWLKE